MFNILYLYNSTQTYTNTVYEHISSFAKYSRHRAFFCHQDPATILNLDLSRFDAIAIHYSIRLPYDQVSPSTVEALAKFKGLKFLFIQDEYDHTHRAWHWIKMLGMQLVFTVVPKDAIERVYPASEFPETRFISILTGYVPDNLSSRVSEKVPSQRPLMIGYRGRPLPIRYGRLAIEKVDIGKIVKSYCDTHSIESDISWFEETRIYGPQWGEFVVSCRSMLGSESGSNVFDWDGTLVHRIAQFRKHNFKAGDDEVYEKFVRAVEVDGLMNQVSPRIFEAIVANTVLVLFEGTYSGVVKADEHFIALKKDGSNLAEVIRLLNDGAFVDALAARAYRDVIASGNYSYQAFASLVDDEIVTSLCALGSLGDEMLPKCLDSGCTDTPTVITIFPFQAQPPTPKARRPKATSWCGRTVLQPRWKELAMQSALFVWFKLPETKRNFLMPRIKRLLRKG